MEERMVKMAKSILQESRECVLSGYQGDYLDKHHVFGGANRKRSESMGLWVYVYKPLHNNSPESIHEDYQLNLMLKKWAQRLCMEHYDMTVEQFIVMFGKNYLLDDSDYEINPPFGREFCINEC